MSRRCLLLAAAAVSAALAILPAAGRAAAPETVSPGTLARLVATPGAVLVIDLRSSSEFMAGTVAGALHGRLTPGTYVPEAGAETVVLVPPTDAGGAALAAWVDRLGGLGLRVLVLQGTPQAWLDAGVPMLRPRPAYADPAAVPFAVPRGICEHLPPVEEYRQ